MEFKMSVEETAKSIWVMLEGPPKNGKTVCAATASANFPETFGEAGSPVVKLEDIVYLQFDKGGMDSLGSLRLDVPFADLSACSTENDIKKTLGLALKGIAERKPKTLIVDGLSTLDRAMIAALTVRFENKFGLYDALLAFYMQFLAQIRQLPMDVIFVVHTKAQNMEVGADAKTASSLPGMAQIVPDISGRTLGYLRGQVSLQLPTLATKVGKKVEYAIYPNGTRGFEAGSRFPGLPDKMEPNLNKLFKLIRRGGE